jgi:hypothetical protein
MFRLVLSHPKVLQDFVKGKCTSAMYVILLKCATFNTKLFSLKMAS